MLREVGQGVLLFLLPFVAYIAVLFAQSRVPFMREAWSSPRLAVLIALGIGCVILGLVALGLFGSRQRGEYRPAHMENGRLVPGRIE